MHAGTRGATALRGLSALASVLLLVLALYFLSDLLVAVGLAVARLLPLPVRVRLLGHGHRRRLEAGHAPGGGVHHG